MTGGQKVLGQLYAAILFGRIMLQGSVTESYSCVQKIWCRLLGYLMRHRFLNLVHSTTSDFNKILCDSDRIFNIGECSATAVYNQMTVVYSDDAQSYIILQSSTGLLSFIKAE